MKASKELLQAAKAAEILENLNPAVRALVLIKFMDPAHKKTVAAKKRRGPYMTRKRKRRLNAQAAARKRWAAEHTGKQVTKK